MQQTLLAWSSGKDSAWTLHVLQQCGNVAVTGLFTTINESAARVAMHAVRRELVTLQADSAGLPVDFIPLPHPCSNAEYEAALGAYLDDAKRRGVTHVAYGDLFLEDVRRYREASMRDSGITPVFPLFGSNTRELARTMVDAGLNARITCVDPAQMPAGFAGRNFDAALLDALPDVVDPCGENGEFHTFVMDGPMFRKRIPVSVGQTVQRDGFVFTDLLIADGDGALQRRNASGPDAQE